MEKQIAIETLIETKVENIKKYRGLIKKEEAEVNHCINVLNNLPDDLLSLSKGVSRCGTYLFLNYPLDKHLITMVKKILDEIEIKFDDDLDWSRYILYAKFGDETIYLKFDEYIDGSTCKLKKIGEREVKKVESVYEIDCLKT